MSAAPIEFVKARRASGLGYEVWIGLAMAGYVKRIADVAGRPRWQATTFKHQPLGGWHTTRIAAAAAVAAEHERRTLTFDSADRLIAGDPS